MDALTAYAAGLIDGEGCITMNKYWDKRGKPNNHRYWVIVIIGMTDEEPLRALWEKWGGSLTRRKRANKKWKLVWVWQISCQKAYRFLEDILPYLKAKRPQAMVALQFRDATKNEKVIPTMGCTYRLLPDNIEKREMYLQQMRSLNHRGSPPATTERVAPTDTSRVKRQSGP